MYSTMMLDGSDSLDDVLSFLSQIDLPALTPLDEATHAAGVQEVHDPSPLVDLLAAPSAVERFSVDQNILQQTPVPFDVPQVDSLSSQVVPTRPNSPTSSEDSPELTGTESSKSKPKRIRISRKQQIETLREEVQELQAELQTLIPQWQSGPKHLSLRLNGQCVPRQASMWQQIAARQLERRQKSEEDNARLRDMLQIQVHEARNLRRVLKRRTKLELMEEMLGMKRHKLLEYGVPEDNSQVYEDMMSDIDELYVGTEELLAQKGMHDLPCPGRHRVAHCNVTDGLFLELLQRHSVPFELRKTEKALWKAIRRIEFQDLNTVKEFANIAQFHAVNIEESTNTMKISYFAEAPNIAFLKGAQVRKVVRKYVESNRVVLICKALMQPVLRGHGKSSGFHSRTTLRVVLRKEDSQPSGKDEVSLLETHFSGTRHDQGLSAARDIRRAPNMEFGIAMWDEAVSSIIHHVESLAIDDSISKTAVPK